MTWKPCCHFLPKVCWHFKWGDNHGLFWPSILLSWKLLRTPGWEGRCLLLQDQQLNSPAEHHWPNKELNTQPWCSCCPYQTSFLMTVFPSPSAIAAGFYVILLYKDFSFEEILFSSFEHLSFRHWTSSKTEERTKPKEKRRKEDKGCIPPIPSAKLQEFVSRISPPTSPCPEQSYAGTVAFKKSWET